MDQIIFNLKFVQIEPQTHQNQWYKKKFLCFF